MLGTPRRAEFLHASHAHRFARRSAVRWARSLQPGHGDLATVGVSGPMPMGFVVGRVEESTPVSQQLQHPLRGYACDPRCWTIFFRASRGPVLCARARGGLRSAARTAARTAARMATASGAPNRTPTRASSPQACCASTPRSSRTDASTQRVANNPHTRCTRVARETNCTMQD